MSDQGGGADVDLSRLAVQLLLKTRITRNIRIDGVTSEETSEEIAKAIRGSLTKYDWTTTPSAEAWLDWVRKLEPRHVEVPRVRTPLTGEGLRGALYMGHLRAIGRPAGEVRLSMATAHLAAVHGEDMRDTWVWNLGNWPVDDAYRGAWCRAPGGDRRAYAEPLEGAAAHWDLMRGRYADALEAFDLGEPAQVKPLLVGWHDADADFARRIELAWSKLSG